MKAVAEPTSAAAFSSSNGEYVPVVLLPALIRNPLVSLRYMSTSAFARSSAIAQAISRIPYYVRSSTTIGISRVVRR